MSKEIEKFIPGSTAILFVDIGNTSIKAAYKKGVEWKQPNQFGLDSAADLLDWINNHSLQFELIVISSVLNKISKALIQNLKTRKYRVLNIHDIPPGMLNYKTPETLGIDRFFVCYGAVAYTGTASVIIDLGTACTIDYMAGDYLYRGGVIMPGISIIEKSLQNYVPGLPAVRRSLPVSWPGNSTKSCLQWGVTGAFIEGINGMLEKYDKQFNSYQLVITGGDAEWLAAIINREAKVRPMLIFEGMERFLEDGF